MTDSYAVVGAGPLGSCAARAMAERLEEDGRAATIHLIDANNPIDLAFDSMSAAGPHAAGQLMLHVFDADSPAKELTRRSHAILRQWSAHGAIELHRRPWICCTGNSGSALDVAAQEVLAQAHGEGRFEGCRFVRGESLEPVVGLRTEAVGWALTDRSTMAVNPREFVRQLAMFAGRHPFVQPTFNTRVIGVDGNVLRLEHVRGTSHISVKGLILCTGIHRDLFTDALPASRPEYLHVTEHNQAGHEPEVKHLITGETTIARYAGFGPGRARIVPLLDEEIRRNGIHGLFTDVPGLRRMLDSHFADRDAAERESPRVWPLLRKTIGRYIAAEYLMGDARSNRSTDASYLAAYTKLLDSDGPWIRALDAPCPVVYVQPSNGLGLNQCAALGHDAAALLAERLT